MHTPRAIYEKYTIPPWLQLHQLRVAAVAKMVCKVISAPVDTDLVVRACCIHDMGNILKFDLDPRGPLASFFGDDLPYWRGVQEDFERRFGADEKQATSTIAREIGVTEEAISIIEHIGFGHIEELLKDSSWEMKIAEYGDMRVGPNGVVTVRERAEDGRRRYSERLQRKGGNPQTYYDALAHNAEELERVIFSKASLSPQDIHDTSIAPILEELWDYEIA